MWGTAPSLHKVSGDLQADGVRGAGGLLVGVGISHPTEALPAVYMRVLVLSSVGTMAQRTQAGGLAPVPQGTLTWWFTSPHSCPHHWPRRECECVEMGSSCTGRRNEGCIPAPIIHHSASIVLPAGFTHGDETLVTEAWRSWQGTSNTPARRCCRPSIRKYVCSERVAMVMH